jgi:hypothetical protein
MKEYIDTIIMKMILNIMMATVTTGCRCFVRLIRLPLIVTAADAVAVVTILIWIVVDGFKEVGNGYNSFLQR